MNKLKIILVILISVVSTWKLQEVRYERKISDLNVVALHEEVDYLKVELSIAQKLNSSYEESIENLTSRLKDVQKSKQNIDAKLRDANNRVYILSGGCSEASSNSTSSGVGESRPYIYSGSFGRISDRVHKAAEWAEQLNYCIDRYNNVRDSFTDS